MLNRNLGRQFLTLDEVSRLHSRDFGVPMSEVFGAMQTRWDQGVRDHMTEEMRGGPRKYVDLLKADIAENGMRKPIKVRDGAVTDGHHRAIAAMELGLDKIPVKVIR